MAKKQFLKLRRLAEDQDITTDELAAKAGIVPRTLRKRFAAPESCGTGKRSPPFAGSFTSRRSRSESISSRRLRKEHKHEGKTLHQQ
jgi:hypothetical protein